MLLYWKFYYERKRFDWLYTFKSFYFTTIFFSFISLFLSISLLFLYFIMYIVFYKILHSWKRYALRLPQNLITHFSQIDLICIPVWIYIKFRLFWNNSNDNSKTHWNFTIEFCYVYKFSRKICFKIVIFF